MKIGCAFGTLIRGRDIQRRVKSVYRRGNVLIEKFKFSSDDVKVKLFTSYCSSLYCAQLWCKFKQKYICKKTCICLSQNLQEFNETEI